MVFSIFTYKKYLSLRGMIPFYNHFVDEINLKNIPTIKERRKYWVYSFSYCLFVLAGLGLPSIFGYGLDNIFSLVMFCFYCFYFFLACCFFLGLIKLEKKYHVFKKKYLYILNLPYFLITLGVAISAIFTTTTISNEDGSFHIYVNTAYFFLLFLPAYLGYLTFGYYAYAKCFSKYCHE